MLIFNGRLGNDRYIGKATTDTSVIDYILGSPLLTNMAKMFKIDDFDPVISDKHCIVEFMVHLSSEVSFWVQSTEQVNNADIRETEHKA